MIIAALVCKTNAKRKILYRTLEKMNKLDYRDLLVMTKEADICKD